ncbi:hypothetical protein LSAT2_022443 [Lamellibrachia satsuma]|nr:hypothetical protein LSAT2_022443 [Lamellibrachia satsuma]
MIGADFHELGVFLGMTSYTINEIAADNRGSVAVIAVKILEKWMKADKSQDMYKMYIALLDALSKMEKNDLVRFVKDGARRPSEIDQQGHKIELGKKVDIVGCASLLCFREYMSEHLELVKVDDIETTMMGKIISDGQVSGFPSTS